MPKQKRYWFKRKRYGWGWVPVTWQGMAVIGVYLALILIGAASLLDEAEESYSAEVGVFMIAVFILTVQLILVAYKRGPAPKWRWGKSAGDNPDEDF